MSHIQSLLALMQFNTQGKRYQSRTVQQGKEEIELLLDGRAVVMHQDQLVQLSPGDLVWHKSGEQTIFSNAAGDDYECLILAFSVNEIKPPVAKVRRWQGVISARQFADDALSQLDANGSKHALAEYLYQSCLIHSSPLFQATSELSFPAQRAFNLAYQFIAQNYAKPSVTVNTMADAAHVSPSFLHAVFKDMTGYTPHQKIQQFRMEAALVLLQENRPIKQVAKQCGFATESGFNRAFRKYYSRGPGHFRSGCSDVLKPARIAF